MHEIAAHTFHKLQKSRKVTSAPPAYLEHLANGACVVTPTAHLAREVRGEFDRQQRENGRRAWTSADVLPYDAFVERLWHQCRASRASPLLLNPWQLAAVWENIIRKDINEGGDGDETAPLWNTHATARLAVAAWRLAHDFCIDLAACGNSKHEDHRRWARWAKNYRAHCMKRNWIDAHCLAENIIEMLRDDANPISLTPQKIIFTGFDQLHPLQQKLCGALRETKTEITIETPPRINHARRPEIKIIKIQVCENSADEWLHAACWARDKIKHNPHARIAIVTPNLTQNARAIDHACRQILCPQQMLAPGVRAGRPYHIALGENLIDYPVAQAALLALIPLSGAPLSSEDVGNFLLSPFLGDAKSEAAARIRQARRCRRRLPYQIRFTQLLHELQPDDDNARADKPHCPKLLKRLQDARGLLQDIKQKKPAGHWARVFTDWLNKLGWPGERVLDSDEYQAARATRRELRHLALLETTAPPMRAADALLWLRRRLAEQPFQVEAHDAPLQILGVREAAGRHFDALWFGGLIENDWPPQQRPSPFIAVQLQQSAGVADASSEGGRDYAALQQQRLLASADDVVLSRPRMQEDIVNESSALLDELQADWKINASDIARADFDTPANIMHAQKPELETFTDARGPAFAPGDSAGGVSLIADQAQCPFRAFVKHRLGANDSEENEQGLNAAERGTLMHRALQSLWSQINTSEKLHALSENELRELIEAAARDAGKRSHFSSGCGDKFLQTQTQWVSGTLYEWMQNEKQRFVSFRAEQLEQKFELNLSGLMLTMKIDRIDQLEDGRRALIDYKTGKSDDAQHWHGARARSPQLPLYALAQKTPPDALAFGTVKLGDCAFHGVARESKFIEAARASKNMPAFDENKSLREEFANWDAWFAHWRDALQQLAQEFLDGEARVNPQPGACKYCGLESLCRIDASARKL